jgi:hypothetical protein
MSISIDTVYGRFWNTNTAGWTVWIDGLALTQRSGMNVRVRVPRKFKTQASARAAAEKYLQQEGR